MKIIFLDIDGVLNNCVSSGVFFENSTIKSCIDFLNEIIIQTDSKIVIISTWKDMFSFNLIRDLLYSRGVLQESIISSTEKYIPKEQGIKKYLQNNSVDRFVIVDDNMIFEDSDFNEFYFKTNSHTGLQQENIEQIIEILK